MRRKDREITEHNQQLEILQKADAVRLAFAVDNEPYIVAMTFGFIWKEKLTLYMHCAREGKKLDMMRRNNKVCFQMDADHQLVIDQVACRWSMNYASIVGRGTLNEVTDETERFSGLNFIMANYGKKGGNRFPAETLQTATVLRLDVDEISVKQKKE
jgi:uncharacterized protein